MDQEKIYTQLRAMKDEGFTRFEAVAYVVKQLKWGTLREVEPISRMVAPINSWKKPED